MSREEADKYEYREVQCPWCDHIFLWRKNSGEGLILHKYRLKTTGEYVETTKCPLCNMEMAVLEHILTGVDQGDSRLESITGITGKCPKEKK